MPQSNILNQILKEASQLSKRPLCVFDLDSTLICVSERIKKILQSVESNEKFKHWNPSQFHKIKTITVKNTDFSLKDVFERASIHLSNEQYRLIHKYWAYCFFSNSFLNYDTLYKGVQNYLHQISIHSEIMYLTGRSRELMEEGTYKQIRKWSLPLKTDNHLIMKPNSFTEDAVYKKIQLERLVQQYKNIWFFENDPAIINYVNSCLPQIQIVFMQSASRARQTLRKSFPTIGMDYSL